MKTSKKAQRIYILLLIWSLTETEIYATIDLNAAELQYLADHLSQEECRRLIAAAHFKSFQEPNALDQAERKIPKDVPCIDLLFHWNAQAGEGKGETHEALEHRLRQMEKNELADWLGKTVFHQLSQDLEQGLEHGLEETNSTENFTEVITLNPAIQEDYSPTDYNYFDSILYMIIIALTLTIFGLCFKFCFDRLRAKCKNRKIKKPSHYELVESESSDPESEERFDIRNARKNLDQNK